MTAPPAAIRVLAVDDHPLVRAGLESVLRSEADLTVVGEAANGEAAVAAYREHRPDVTLMDLRMPGMDGVDAIRAIRRDDPDARVLALTTYDGDADIRRALDAGARGYLLKDMVGTEVAHAVRAVHRGERVIPPAVAVRLAAHTPGVALTPRELEVLRLVATGLTNKDVAREIGRTEETVKSHLAAVFHKLEAADRTEAVIIALRRGVIRLD